MKLKVDMVFVLMLSPINHLVWNIRGASRMDSLRYLKNMVLDFNVKILVLLEPKSEVGQFEVVQNFLKF